MPFSNLVLIDDDTFYHEYVSQCLSENFTVSCCTNTNIDMKLLATTHILMLDLCLPGSDAIVFLEHAKLFANKISLVFISGTASKTIASAIQVAQLYGFRNIKSLSKPFSPNDLHQTIAELQAFVQPEKVIDTKAPSPLTFSSKEFINGLEEGLFFCHFQPQISLNSRYIWGLEALARWQHPELGVLGPLHFLAYANSPEFASSFFLAILNDALKNLIRIEAATSTSQVMSVNLSSASLNDCDIPDKVSELLTLHRVASSKLTIEITEHGTSNFNVVSAQTIARLKILGVTVSIDDFGAGDSGLTKLKNFSFDEIKIDKAFIDDITCSLDSKTILRSVIEMATHLNLVIIIEGVEKREQFEWLKSEFHSANLIIQGYYFSRPLSLKSIVAVLQENRGHF